MAELGGDNAQMALGILKVVTGLFKGILLFFLLAGATLQHYVEWTSRRLHHERYCRPY